MAAAYLIGGVVLGGMGAFVSLVTGGTILAAALAYTAFGQIGIVMMLGGSALRWPFRVDY